MIGVKVVGLVGKRMEEGVGLGLEECGGGWIELESEGRQAPHELDRKHVG